MVRTLNWRNFDAYALNIIAHYDLKHEYRN